MGRLWMPSFRFHHSHLFPSKTFRTMWYVSRGANTLLYMSDFSLHLKADYNHMICTPTNNEFPWISNQAEFSRHNFPPNPPTASNSLFLPMEPLRYPGDGFDFRRPAMSAPQSNVIDLTQDLSPVEQRDYVDLDPASRFLSSRATRPPRFQRDIIDLEELDDTLGTAAVRPVSPEIEFVSSRPLPSTVRNRSRSLGLGEGNVTTLQNSRPAEANRNAPTGPWQDLRNQVSRVQQSLRHPTRVNPLNALIRRDLPSQTPPRNQFSDVDFDTIFIDAGQNMILPGDLDFSAQGFLMGDGARPAPAPPTYDAPSAPRQGFTRSPREEDTLVCPNCEEELGIGEDETKRQVWVIKSCGHVCPMITSLHRVI